MPNTTSAEQKPVGIRGTYSHGPYDLAKVVDSVGCSGTPLRKVLKSDVDLTPRRTFQPAIANAIAPNASRLHPAGSGDAEVATKPYVTSPATYCPTISPGH